MGRMVLLLAFICSAALANAQDAALDRDVLFARTAKVRAQLLKDSIPITTVQLDTLRVRAEAVVKPVMAIKWWEQSLVIADSLRDAARERDVLFSLANAYEAGGRTDDALWALRAGHFLKDSLAAAELATSQEAARLRIEQEFAERKAEQLRLQEELRARDAEVAALTERLQWTYALAGAAIVLLLIAVFVLARRKRKPIPPPVAIIERAPEVVPEVKRNVLRPEATSPPVVEAPPIGEGDVVRIAMLRKMLPERLRTLQEARQRGDHEKVLRVVHSLKPHLMAHDPARFSDLLDRIKASSVDPSSQEFTANADALVVAIEGIMREV